MSDEQTINRALREARRQLSDVETRIQWSRIGGHEDRAQRWDDQHGRPLRNRIAILETQLKEARGEAEPGAVLTLIRQQMTEQEGAPDDDRSV